MEVHYEMQIQQGVLDLHAYQSIEQARLSQTA
jgi:hypothetical protein